MNEDAKTKLMARIRVTDSGCWEWMGGRHGKHPQQQYGVIWLNGTRHKTHRLAFELFKRPLVDGEWACHHCDNPPCCNPDHLFAGTALDNTRDCAAKGRLHRERGEDRYNATLTEDAVREMRAAYQWRKNGGYVGLARRFDVSKSMAFAIVNRMRWKHV